MTIRPVLFVALSLAISFPTIIADEDNRQRVSSNDRTQRRSSTNTGTQRGSSSKNRKSSSSSNKAEVERAVRKALQDSKRERTTKIRVDAVPMDVYNTQNYDARSSNVGQEQYDKYREERRKLRIQQQRQNASLKKKRAMLKQMAEAQKEKEAMANKMITESENMTKELEERHAMQQQKQEELLRRESDLSKWENELKTKVPTNNVSPASNANKVSSMNISQGIIIRETLLKPAAVNMIHQQPPQQSSMMQAPMMQTSMMQAPMMQGRSVGQMVGQSYVQSIVQPSGYMVPGNLITVNEPQYCNGACQPQKRKLFR